MVSLDKTPDSIFVGMIEARTNRELRRNNLHALRFKIQLAVSKREYLAAAK
ncbi:hypothetical protein KGG72_gp79 [Streptomyces phage Salutena]|uniref:Uncharacterized protein n=1 Tax=Streptomyces phage Salutena TaxID=2767576 RepID=A0A7S6R7A7_9CAUD|nr:hypothetical protein KGG72_gp79 [Streptomyces phage Salutena]QOV06209.1 hypothetical protein CPT_Salutena_079 [Streptomyces phage Salutena]